MICNVSSSFILLGFCSKQLQELELDALTIVLALADQFILLTVYVNKVTATQSEI